MLYNATYKNIATITITYTHKSCIDGLLLTAKEKLSSKINCYSRIIAFATEMISTWDIRWKVCYEMLP